MSISSKFSIYITCLFVYFSPFLLAKASNKDIIPFRNIGQTLGARGNNNNTYSGGVTLADVNDDGLLDLYLPSDGRPIWKATSSNGVLSKQNNKSLPSTLFLNQGIDEKGDPIMVSVQDLIASGNNEYVREELLIENKYKPRQSISDNEFDVGRISSSSIAADFNGDGKLDLYVLNMHHGFVAQTKETSTPIYPAANNIGRTKSKDKKPLHLMAPPYLRTDMSDGMTKKVDYGEALEWEGSNRLYLNLGDKDADGIPEWEDVTDQSGIGGKWDSRGATVADIDRDGDLDIYVANFLDLDFHGFGMNRFAGNRNQLYLNQLVETGKLTFIDVALDMAVSGLHKEENLANGSFHSELNKVVSVAKEFVNGKQVGEESDHSWSAKFIDWNDDGWPDLVVANDIGGSRMRIYKNIKGKKFQLLNRFSEPRWEGCWMGVGGGDLDGDGSTEILATNCGSQVLSIRNTALHVGSGNELSTTALSQINYPKGYSTLHHVLFSYTKDGGLEDVTTKTTVHHSKIIPPDMTDKNNAMPVNHDFYEDMNYRNGLAGLEFSWGPVIMDVDNDSDLDIYLAGSLSRGNDGFWGDWFGSPGRLLVNESSPGNFIFRDKVLDYQLLDINGMEYGYQPPRRKAPGTGWHKRDYIYITDKDSYSEMGVNASEKSSTHDIFRMHEAAMGMVSGDLNNDGFPDIVVAHVGGYNSLSPTAKNLKVNISGQNRAIPGTDKLRHPPTNYEPGETFLYINGGVEDSDNTHWVKLKLLDHDSKNRYGVGSKVIINKKITRLITLGGTAFSSYTGDLLVGLGHEKLNEVVVRWPSGEQKSRKYLFSSAISKTLVCIDREKGQITCPD